MRVLVVDGNASPREIMSDILKTDGFQVDSFPSEAAAAYALENVSPDNPYRLAIVDHKMTENGRF